MVRQPLLANTIKHSTIVLNKAATITTHLHYNFTLHINFHTLHNYNPLSRTTTIQSFNQVSDQPSNTYTPLSTDFAQLDRNRFRIFRKIRITANLNYTGAKILMGNLISSPHSRTIKSATKLMERSSTSNSHPTTHQGSDRNHRA